METGETRTKSETSDGKTVYYFQLVTFDKQTKEQKKSVLFNVFSDAPNFDKQGLLNGTLDVILKDIVKYKKGDTLNWDINQEAESDMTIAERVTIYKV